MEFKLVAITKFGIRFIAFINKEKTTIGNLKRECALLGYEKDDYGLTISILFINITLPKIF